MGTYNEHFTQAKHNLGAAKFLTGQDLAAYRDWVVTMCFYSGVHCAEAAFSHMAVPVHTETACAKFDKHAWREKLIAKAFPTASDDYRTLRNLSGIARYKSSRFINVSDAANSPELVENIRKEMKLPPFE